MTTYAEVESIEERLTEDQLAAARREYEAATVACQAAFDAWRAAEHHARQARSRWWALLDSMSTSKVLDGENKS